MRDAQAECVGAPGPQVPPAPLLMHHVAPGCSCLHTSPRSSKSPTLEKPSFALRLTSPMMPYYSQRVTITPAPQFCPCYCHANILPALTSFCPHPSCGS